MISLKAVAQTIQYRGGAAGQLQQRPDYGNKRRGKAWEEEEEEGNDDKEDDNQENDDQEEDEEA